MSEIKGQFLGMILVLAIFGAVAGIIYGAFQSAAQNVASEIVNPPTVSVSEQNVTSMNYSWDAPILH